MSRGPAGTAKTRAAAAAAAAATTPANKKAAVAGSQKSYAHHQQQRQLSHGGMPNKRQRHQLPSASSAATAAGVAVAGAPWVGGSADVSAESSDDERGTMTGTGLRLRTNLGIGSDAAGEEGDDDDDDDDDDEEGDEGEAEGTEEPPEFMLDETANGQKKRIPAFVRKLRSMLDAKDVTLIKWTSDGAAFRVIDSAAFSKQVLPNYFKHNNWQSFIRQLNIYGFMKLSEAAKLEGSNSTHSGVPQSDWSFRHPLFLRKHPRRMEEIKRRTPKEPKPGMMDGEHAWNMVKAARAASQGAASSTSPSTSTTASASAGKCNKRKATLTGGGNANGNISSSGSNNDAGNSSLGAAGTSKPKSFASSSSTSSSSSHLGSAGGSAASSASTSATTVEDSASAVGGDDGSDKDSLGLQLVKPNANGAYDAGAADEEDEEEDVAEGLEDDQVVSTVLVDGKPTPASLSQQVIAMQKQMNGMQKSMAQMAKAQAKAIALTANVLATQLAGMDSSVTSIQNLQTSLCQWQTACETAISRSRHPAGGNMALRIGKSRRSTKRKARNGHQSCAGSSDDEVSLGSEDDAAAEISGTFANSSNIVGFGLSEPPPPLLQHGAPLQDPAAAAGFLATDALQVGVPSQVPMFGYGYSSLSSLYGAPDDSEAEGQIAASSGAPSLPDVLAYDGTAGGDDQAFPAAKRRKR